VAKVDAQDPLALVLAVPRVDQALAFAAGLIDTREPVGLVVFV
jgi:hypothetical protein